MQSQLPMERLRWQLWRKVWIAIWSRKRSKQEISYSRVCLHTMVSFQAGDEGLLGICLHFERIWCPLQAHFSLPGDHLIYLCVSKDHGLHNNNVLLDLEEKPWWQLFLCIFFCCNSQKLAPLALATTLKCFFQCNLFLSEYIWVNIPSRFYTFVLSPRVWQSL